MVAEIYPRMTSLIKNSKWRRDLLKGCIDLAKPKSGAPLFVLSVFCFCFLFCFYWQLLICENTLIQVVLLKKKTKKKKKRKNILAPAERRTPARRREMPVTSPLGHGRLTLFSKLILILISFFVTSCLSA